MSIAKSFEDRAASLRALLASDDEQRLSATVDDLRRTYHEKCAELVHGGPQTAAHSQAEILGSRLSELSAMLLELRGARADAAVQLRSIEAMLGAAKRAPAARSALREATGRRVKAHDALSKAGDALAELMRLHAAEMTAAEAARGSDLAEVIGQLPDGFVAAAGLQAPAGSGQSSAHHLRRAAGFEEAIRQGTAKVKALRADLERAASDERHAKAHLLEQVAHAAELEHAEALAAYVAALSTFRAAHAAAFDMVPPTPDIDSLIESRAFEEAHAIRAAADDDGAAARSRRKVLPWL